MSLTRSLIGITVALGLAGCGNSVDRSPTAPVSGTVTFDGKPLAKGTILFESDHARPANGRIENGRIVEVYTYEAGDGVPVGRHRVAVFAQAETDSAVATHPGDTGSSLQSMSTPSLIPERYNDPQQSGLTAEINEGEDNALEFKLESE